MRTIKKKESQLIESGVAGAARNSASSTATAKKGKASMPFLGATQRARPEGGRRN